jgi:hypothetical protein
LSGKKETIRQGWDNQIGLGAYKYPETASVASGYVADYKAKNKTDFEDKAELVRQWYNFADQLTPDVAGVVYDLFPDVQTRESVQYYGLTQGMVDALKVISKKLVNPKDIKTTEDINRIFAADAVKIYSRDINTKPESGLYKNTAEYGNYIGVY